MMNASVSAVVAVSPTSTSTSASVSASASASASTSTSTSTSISTSTSSTSTSTASTLSTTSSVINNNNSSTNDINATLRTSSVCRPTLPLQDLTTLQNNESLRKKANNLRRGKCSFQCSFKGCNNNTSTPNVLFSRVPPPQTKTLPADLNKIRLRDIKAFHKKQLHHHLFLKQMGRKDTDWKTGMRICNEHPKEEVKKKKSIPFKGKTVDLDFTFEVPANIGMKSHLGKQPASDATRVGNAYERSVLRKWEMRKRDLEKNHSAESADRIVELEKLVQSLVENNTPVKEKRNKARLSSSITDHFGLLPKSPPLKKNK